MTDKQQTQEENPVQKWLDEHHQDFLDAGFKEDDLEVVHGAVAGVAQQFGNLARQMQLPPKITVLAARLIADYFQDPDGADDEYTRKYIDSLKNHLKEIKEQEQQAANGN